MDLRKLEIFASVAKHGGFSAAARELDMAQPAVSIAVQKLEAELGLCLIDRGSSTAWLTVEGQRLLAHADRVLADVAALQDDMHSLKGLLSGQVSIACPSMVATYHLPDLLGAFLRREPQLTASVTQLGTQDVEHRLRQGELELGVIAGKPQPDDAELGFLPLLKEKLCVALHPDHPLARRRFLRIQDLHGLPLLMYESGYYIRDLFLRSCEAEGIRPDVRMQTNFLPLLIAMAQQGVGATLGLRLMAEREQQLRFVPLSPALEVDLMLARRRNRKLSVANQAFYQWVSKRGGEG